jgi:hypothetical protein
MNITKPSREVRFHLTSADIDYLEHVAQENGLSDRATALRFLLHHLRKRDVVIGFRQAAAPATSEEIHREAAKDVKSDVAIVAKHLGGRDKLAEFIAEYPTEAQGIIAAKALAAKLKNGDAHDARLAAAPPRRRGRPRKQ